VALNKYFYPRLQYGTGPTTIDFVKSLLDVQVSEIPIKGVNTSIGGRQETLFERMEVQVTLRINHEDVATLTALLTYWRSSGALGKQATLVLDRLGTCAGQYEYDNYNTYFTKFELLTNPFKVVRSLSSSARYAIDLTGRQGL
jgi:hypothetical protein